MAERKSVRLESHQLAAIEDMVERGAADNESEAHRMLLNAGKREYGYKNGGYTNTTLRQATSLLARWFTIAGLVLVGVTWWYPVEFRVLVVAPIISGLFLFGVERILADVEPDVTRRLKGLFGSETA